MLIKGSQLNLGQRAMVLERFGYRWTVENEERARRWLRGGRFADELVSDNQWVADHAFYFIKDGSRLDARRVHAEPHYLAD